MRRAFVVLILLCIAYFLCGWVGVSRNWIPKDTYFQYAGVVGGLASVAGLVALTRPAITRSDIQRIELDSLKSIAETEDQLQKAELARARAEGQLVELAAKKKQMELLVKKASLALFLKDQHAYHERQVLEEIGRNSQLRDSLRMVGETEEKLAALDDEIEGAPDVLELRQILASASKRQPTLDEAIGGLSPFARSAFITARLMTRLAERVFAVLREG